MLLERTERERPKSPAQFLKRRFLSMSLQKFSSVLYSILHINLNTATSQTVSSTIFCIARYLHLEQTPRFTSSSGENMWGKLQSIVKLVYHGLYI